MKKKIVFVRLQKDGILCNWRDNIFRKDVVCDSDRLLGVSTFETSIDELQAMNWRVENHNGFFFDVVRPDSYAHNGTFNKAGRRYAELRMFDNETLHGIERGAFSCATNDTRDVKFVYARFPDLHMGEASYSSFNYINNVREKGTKPCEQARLLCLVPSRTSYYSSNHWWHHDDHAREDSYLPFWDDDFKRLKAGDDKDVNPIDMYWLLSECIIIDGTSLLDRLHVMCDSPTQMKHRAVRDWTEKEMRCGMRFFFRRYADFDGEGEGPRNDMNTVYWGTLEEVKHIKSMGIDVFELDESAAASALVYDRNAYTNDNGVRDGFAYPLVDIGDEEGAAMLMGGEQLDDYCDWLKSREVKH